MNWPPAVRALVTAMEGLYPELIARPRLALGDAFHLGRVQRIELVGTVRLLGQDLCRPLTRGSKGGLEFSITGDLFCNRRTSKSDRKDLSSMLPKRRRHAKMSLRNAG